MRTTGEDEVKLSFDFARSPEVVCVYECDERGAGGLPTSVSCGSNAGITLTGAALVCLAACVRSAFWLLPCFILATLALCMDAGLLKFIYRKRGFRSFVVAASMTLVQNVCKLVATIGGLLVFASRSFPAPRLRRGDRRSQILDRRQAREEESVRLSKQPSTMYG